MLHLKVERSEKSGGIGEEDEENRREIGREQLIDDPPLENYLHLDPFLGILLLLILQRPLADDVHCQRCLFLHHHLKRDVGKIKISLVRLIFNSL